MELVSDLFYKKIKGGMNWRIGYFVFLIMGMYFKVLGIKNIFKLIFEREWINFKRLFF